jgi:hypothetical protein
MSRRKQKRSEVLIFKTFEIQWINHPQFGNSFQYVAEDLLYEDITVDLESFAIAEDLNYADAMFRMILLEYTTELVKLLGLLPTLVLCSGIGLAMCQFMFTWLAMTEPPEE